MESVTVAKANALAAADGNEVYIVVTDHKHGAGPSARLDASVRVVDLGVRYYDDDWRSKYHVLKGFFFKRRLHKRRLAAALALIVPDVVISVGQSEKYMLTDIKGPWVCIRELHYHKDYRRLASASRSVFYKIAARLSDFWDYHCKIGKYDSVVVLTKYDLHNNWKDRKNFLAIPNFVTFRNTDRRSSLSSKKVITAGRLAAEKNFSSLICAFSIVAERHPDWILEIYGDGNERRTLQNLIGQLHLESSVCLCGSTRNVQDKMCASSIFVLSSVYEGLPLAMLEAMSCGLPVVSYDCPCGPKDIITDGVDGYLVPAGDERMLAERICCLIENPDKRAEMGVEAVKKSGNYSVDKIIPMWMDLFERLVAEKHGEC